MGVAESKQAGANKLTSAAKYGELGELGPVLGVCVYGSVTRAGSGPVVVAAGAEHINQYNASSADRKLRVKRKDLITCVCFKPDTLFGPLLYCGSDSGDVSLYDVTTLAEFKTIRTNGTPARERAASGSPPSGGAGAVPRYAVTGPAVTSVAAFSTKSFFAGHADGVVRTFSLSGDGALLNSFCAPEYVPDPAVSRGGDVTALAVYGSAQHPMLAVGHRDGTIHNFHADSGALAAEFKTLPGLTQLLSLHRFGAIAAVHAGKNTLQLWDLDCDRAGLLDFSSELESIHRKSSQMQYTRYDDARGVILCGADDGSVFVREVSRIQGTNDLAVKLARFNAPSASATAPSKITTMWYDTRTDNLYTADMSGLVRMIPLITGVAYRTIAPAARHAAEAHDSADIEFRKLMGAGSPAPRPSRAAIAAARDTLEGDVEGADEGSSSDEEGEGDESDDDEMSALAAQRASATISSASKAGAATMASIMAAKGRMDDASSPSSDASGAERAAWRVIAAKVELEVAAEAAAAATAAAKQEVVARHLESEARVAKANADSMDAARRRAEDEAAVIAVAASAAANRIAAAEVEAARVAAANAETARFAAQELEAAKLALAAQQAAALIAAAEKEALRLKAAEEEESARVASAAYKAASRINAAVLETARVEAERAEALRVAETKRLNAEAAAAELAAAQAASAEAEAQRFLAAEQNQAARIRMEEQLEAARLAAAQVESAARIAAANEEAARVAAQNAETAAVAAAELAAAQEVGRLQEEAARVAEREMIAARAAALEWEAGRPARLAAAEAAATAQVAAEVEAHHQAMRDAEAARVAAIEAEAAREEAERVAKREAEAAYALAVEQAASRIAAAEAQAAKAAAEAEAERAEALRIAEGAERVAAAAAAAAAEELAAARIAAAELVAARAVEGPSGSSTEELAEDADASSSSASSSAKSGKKKGKGKRK